ncbi:MAG: DNA-directed RNA polymerase subunit N [Promethearchaeota archaeon]|jgi:DNA-directed RNA polymerase subunit N (RpoN/RPB10)
MIIPIRCFTCSKVVANKWIPYENMINEGVEPKEALDRLGLKRQCCRRMLFTHVDLIEPIMEYSTYDINNKETTQR